MSEAKYREAEQRLFDRFEVAPKEHWLDLTRTGARIRALEAGDGPPVVFLHGGSNAGASWAPLLGELGDFRCIAIDRPGCGLSPPVGARFHDMASLEAFGDALVADVLDALDVARAHVVGTSYGGYFSLRSAAAAPDRIDRVVQLGFPMGAKMVHLPAVMRMAAVPGLGVVTASLPTPKWAIRPMLRQIGLGHAIDAGIFDQEAVDWYHALLRHTGTMANELKAGPRVITPVRGQNPELLHSTALLGSITQPVWFLWGEDDPFGGRETAEPFVAQIPGAQLQMVPDAGHAVWMDDPAGIATAVQTFLRG